MEESNNKPSENNLQEETQQPKVQEVPQESQTNQTVQANTTNYNNYSANTSTATKKKGKGGLIAAIVIIAILVMAIVGGLAYFFGVYQRADQVYKRLVGSIMDSYSKQLDQLDYETVKSSMEFSADVDIENIDKDVKDLINNIDLAMDVQLDNKNKQFVLNIESDYDKKDLLNLQLFSDIKDEKSYIYLKDLLDKYIEVELEEDDYESITKLLDMQKDIADRKESIKKAISIVKKEIINSIKKEYCSSDKTELNINGKKVNATKITLKMNEKQFTSEVKTIMKNLKENEEFLNCFEDDKDDVKEFLSEAIDEIDEDDMNEDSTMEFAIYSTGFVKSEIVKVECTVVEDDKKVTMSFTKVEDNNYDILVKQNDEEVFTGSIAIEEKSENEGTAKITLKSENLGKISLKMKYSQKLNEKIDSVNVSNSVKMDELTQADQQTLMTNLQKSELYKLIEKFASSNSNFGNSNITSGEDDINTSIDYVTPNTPEMENNTISTPTINNENTTTSELRNNQVISYDDKTKITFGIPTGYSFNRTSENYVTLEKDRVDVTIRSSYDTDDSFYKKLESSKNNYAENTKYTNVNLTAKESKTVNGKTFNYAILSYEYPTSVSTYKYATKYIWSKISDKYVVEIDIRDTDEKMTDDELNQILTMTFEENK